MSKVFARYADYYDLLNQEKDYAAEVSYVLNLNKRYCSHTDRRLLNLGCGTGRHDLIMAERGWNVTGVDRSSAMLAEARRRATGLKAPTVPRFIESDITELKLDEHFALVLSLFHVVSYQTSNEALLRTFRTTSNHLEDGGLFIFDFWFGPAVLHEKPGERNREAKGRGLLVRRHTHPVLHVSNNTVDVNFDIKITDLKSNTVENFSETHVMRYLFLPEINDLLAAAGLELITAEEWLTGKPVGLDTWSVCCVARKIPSNQRKPE